MRLDREFREAVNQLTLLSGDEQDRIRTHKHLIRIATEQQIKWYKIK